MGGDNIRVVNVAPGYIATDLNRDFRENENVRRWMKRRIPVGRARRSPRRWRGWSPALFTPDIGFLTGETIYIDGGQGMNH